MKTDWLRKEDESEYAYIYRIGNIKEQIGSWQDVADLLNYQLGYQYTESKYRKDYAAFCKLFEANRDKLIIYITTRISRAGGLPLEAERDAGKFLYKVIKPYIGIARLPVAQETAKIQGLLIDLRKGENATYVTTLGLEAYLAELEKENNAYIALTSARTQSRAANKKDNSATIRQRLDSQYDDLVTLAQSFSIAVPSEEATTFVSNLNQLISETVTAFNQRKKGSGPAGEGGGGSSDRPEIE